MGGKCCKGGCFVPKKYWIPVAVLLVIVLAIVLWEPVLDLLPIDQSHWLGIDGNMYHIGEKGDRDLGWYEEGGHRYYLDPAREGAMVQGQREIDGAVYCFSDAGLLQTGWMEDGAGRRYHDENGVMLTGWRSVDGADYYFGDEGYALTGWNDLDGKSYYMDDNGAVRTGWTELEDGRHLLDPDTGAAVSGWHDAGEDRLYLDELGRPLEGWQDIDGSRYYLTPAVQTGWLEFDGQRYYLDESGRMVTGWQSVEDKTLYFLESGAMARGAVEIEGSKHYFTSTGTEVILVNRWNPLPEDFTVETVNACGAQVAPECAEALEQMLADCKAAGHGYMITSGYRSISRQQALLNRKVGQMRNKGYAGDEAYERAIQIVAVPGTSEHHLGLAVDIVDSAYVLMNKNQANMDTQKWLMEHCWDYGFILRYPDGSTEATGITYEPWHYRYVGVELAQELKEFGGCLEDYLDSLTADGTTCGGRVN